MIGKIIHLNVERIKRNLQRFEKTGYIDDSLLSASLNSVGGDYARVIYRLKSTLASRRTVHIRESKIDLEHECGTIMNDLSTKHCKFKYPTVLGKYKKDINPVLAIHQEYQYAMVTKEPNKFTRWVINLVDNILYELLDALNVDIQRLEIFLEKVNETIGARFLPHIHHLLHRLITARDDFLTKI